MIYIFMYSETSNALVLALLNQLQKSIMFIVIMHASTKLCRVALCTLKRQNIQLKEKAVYTKGEKKKEIK